MAAEEGLHEVSVRTKRSFVRHEDGDPSVEPLFVNNVEITQVGTDVFVDLGIVRPDDITDFSKQEGQLELPFHVLERIVMSINTFAMVHQKFSVIFKRLKGRDILEDTLKSSAPESSDTPGVKSSST